MTKQNRLTKEFEIPAVSLARTSGRTLRQVAEDLWIGLSTLVRWIGRNRDRPDGDAGAVPSPYVVAELKRLRRENEVLRQERDILTKATAFFIREGSR
jgi:transposase